MSNTENTTKSDLYKVVSVQFKGLDSIETHIESFLRETNRQLSFDRTCIYFLRTMSVTPVMAVNKITGNVDTMIFAVFVFEHMF